MVNFKASHVLFVHDQTKLKCPINIRATIKISKEVSGENGQDIKVGVVDDNHENTKFSHLTSIQNVSLQNHVLKSDKAASKEQDKTKNFAKSSSKNQFSNNDKLTIKVGVVDDNHENTRYYNSDSHEFWLDKGVFKVLTNAKKEVVEKIDLNNNQKVALHYFTIVKSTNKQQAMSHTVKQEI